MRKPHRNIGIYTRLPSNYASIGMGANAEHAEPDRRLALTSQEMSIRSDGAIHILEDG